MRSNTGILPLLLTLVLSIVGVLSQKTVIESAELKSAGIKVEDIASYELNQEPLTISVKLSTTPSQVFVLLKSGGKELSIPTVHRNSKYELTLTNNAIPKFFQKQDLISFELIVGDFDTSANLILPLFDLKVSEKLQNKVNYKPSLRFGKLNEIKHIFKNQQSFVNPIIPIFFIILISLLLITLVSSWLSLDLKLVNLKVIDLLFLITLVIFELIFFGYYIKDSIFTTLARVGILTPISVILGSRVLRNLRFRNMAGQKKLF